MGEESARNTCLMETATLLGLPNFKKVLMAEEVYNNIKIYKALDFTTQKLVINDIKEELDKIPKYLQKQISTIVLSPFSCAMDQCIRERNNIEEGETFATAFYEIGQIIIFASSDGREKIKQKLISEHTILHETGHIKSKFI